MGADFLSPKIDLVFKDIMKNDQALTGFLCAVLSLDPADVRSLTREETQMNPMFPDGKHSILDVRVTLNDEQQINIEIQIAPHRSWTERCLYYLSKMCVDQLKSGEHYKKLIKCVSIGVLDFVWFRESERYYSRFHIAEDTQHFRYSELFELHTLELPKLPQETAEAIRHDPLFQWARFIDARTFEEVKALSQMNPSIEAAAAELNRMASDPNLRVAYQRREMELHDYATMMYELEHGEERAREEGLEKGREEGREEGIEIGAAREREAMVLNMIQDGFAIPVIARITSLPEDRIRQIAGDTMPPM